MRLRCAAGRETPATWPGWVLLVASLATATSSCVGSIGDGVESAEPEREGVDVGTSPLRRVTRSQYGRGVRDLLGVDSGSGAEFVADEKVGPFDSNANAPVSDLAVEDYMVAAEAAAAEAVKSLDDIAPCAPSADEQACARTFIESFGKRAYRRPLDDGEIEGLSTIYAVAREDGPYADGIQLVLQAILQSPHFLYHVELGDEPREGLAPGVRPLTPFELASRLAYFLWSSIPDEELLRAAEAGELQTEEQIAAQTTRMLEDPRAADAIASFHVQWLGLDGLQVVEKDAGVYPEYGPKLARSMQRETELFVDDVVRKGDGLLSTLLRATYTFADASLATLYGVNGPPGDDFERIELDPTKRSGLLTHASLLTKHAHANQTSPVHRGKIIRESLLCDPPPPPPPNVNDQLSDVDPNAPISEKLAQHRTDPACAGCHALMDPIGLGFEGYDAIGRERTMIGDTPVDDHGEFTSTMDIDGPFVGALEMGERLAESEQVRQCVAKQWLRFGTGRLEQPEDATAEEGIRERFASSGYDIRELIVAVAVSPAMRYVRVPEEESK